MNQQPDYIALAIVGVLLLGVLIAVLRKYFAQKNGTAAPVEAALQSLELRCQLATPVINYLSSK